MNHKLLFNEEAIHSFDYSDEYIGYVIDTSNFENDFTIKVFIPELFGYAYTPSKKAFDTNVQISTRHIINREDLLVQTSLNRQEYLNARMLIPRDQISNKESFFKNNTPKIDDKVIVKFFNHNPNNCVFENNIYLADNETIFKNIKRTKNIQPDTIVWDS